MEMSQIRYVLAAARLLNFTKAAAECNVSQPALTKAVKSLEEELGAPLFHREGRRVILSDFGGSILPHLEHIVSEAETTQTLAENFRLLNKVPIRLGVMTSVGHTRFARFLARFQREFGGVELAVSEAPLDDLRGQLIEGELDLAVLNPRDGTAEDLNCLPLYEERYVVILPPDHHLGALNAVRLGDLNGEDYVDRLSCEMREMVMSVCETEKIELYARFRSEREDWVQAMVLARIGFAFMPEYAVALPGLVQRSLVEPAVSRQIVLASVPGRRFSPAASAMVQLAKTFEWPG